MRITVKTLESVVTRLNQAENRQPGTIGWYTLGRCVQGYTLEQQISEHGVVRHMLPVPRLTAREAYNAIVSYKAGLFEGHVSAANAAAKAFLIMRELLAPEQWELAVTMYMRHVTHRGADCELSRSADVLTYMSGLDSETINSIRNAL